MIQRIVLLKLTDPSEIDDVLKKSREVLPNLPGVRKYSQGRVLKKSDYDIALLLTFDSMNDVHAYIPYPAHRAYVDDYLKPKIHSIAAMNVDIGNG
ncbi:hypothetical protein GF324_09585 [bacterium]|nr:hypothetical protein [bacterium]